MYVASRSIILLSPCMQELFFTLSIQYIFLSNKSYVIKILRLYTYTSLQTVGFEQLKLMRPLSSEQWTDGRQTYAHTQTDKLYICMQARFNYVVDSAVQCPFSTLCRLRTLLVDGWELETVLPTLHVSCEMQYSQHASSQFSQCVPRAT